LISVVFGLVGLYLHTERQFSGRQVQEIHKKLGRTERRWPTIYFPADRGRMTALDVVATPEGPERDRAIHDWCESVWNAFHDNREVVIGLLEERNVGSAVNWRKIAISLKMG
jgi:hypothetical protein